MLTAMDLEVTVRPEQPEDAQAIEALIKEAYAAISYSDHREHLMVERLRISAAYIPDLSLLAEIEGQTVGHLMLTRIAVRDGDGSVEGLSLGPLSVLPNFQRRGIGAELINEAHRRARELSYPFIILVGLPEYYPRFSYQPLDTYPVTLPFDVAASNRMILGLNADALRALRGQVEYAPEWLSH